MLKIARRFGSAMISKTDSNGLSIRDHSYACQGMFHTAVTYRRASVTALTTPTR